MRVATHDELFAARRGRLVGLAYRLIGSISDAEDVVQEVWFRWKRADLDRIDNVDAYLVRAVTNGSLNRLRQVKAQRETYPGPWLPEPVVTEPGPEERVEKVDSISLALLVVLESLSPLERAAFVLHDVFGYPHDEVAQILDRSAEAVRQLASRARTHVQARRPRFNADRAQQERATEAFISACATGEIEELMKVLADDAVLVSDGGGKVSAAVRPVEGAARVARFLSGVVQKVPDGAEVERVDLNGQPGFVVRVGAAIELAAVVEADDDGVHLIQFIRNPDKLTFVGRRTRASLT